MHNSLRSFLAITLGLIVWQLPLPVPADVTQPSFTQVAKVGPPVTFGAVKSTQVA